MLNPITSSRLLKTGSATTVLVNEENKLLSYQMTIPGPDDQDGSLCWRLTYGVPSKTDLLVAVSIIDSYEYLLSAEISTAEAINRLRCLRRAYRSQIEERSDTVVSSADQPA